MKYEEYQKLLKGKKETKESISNELSHINKEIAEVYEEIEDYKSLLLANDKNKFKEGNRFKEINDEIKKTIVLGFSFLMSPIIVALLFKQIGVNFIEAFTFFEVIIGVPGAFLMRKEYLDLNKTKKEILKEGESNNNKKKCEEDLIISTNIKLCEEKLISLNDNKNNLTKKLCEICEEEKQWDENIKSALQDYYKEQNIDIPIEHNKVKKKSNIHKNLQ